MKNDPNRVPKHLGRDAKEFWKETVRDYELEPHHVLILTGACECMDRIAEARKRIEVEGCYLANRRGELRAHPANQVERENKILLARLLRELNLDTSSPAEAYSRPPRIGGR